jgi:uncharacterized protein YaaR (DUF327 family)
MDLEITQSIYELYDELNLDSLMSEDDINNNTMLINMFIKKYSNMAEDAIYNASESKIFDIEKEHSCYVFINNIIKTIEKMERVILNNFCDNIDTFERTMCYYIELINL